MSDAEPFQSSVRELTDGERAALNQQLQIARLLCSMQASIQDAPDVLALDQCIEDWYDDPSAGGLTLDEFCNAIGTAFGQLLQERLSLRWVFATDEFGSGVSLYRDKNGVSIFPIEVVAKRIYERERRFLWPLFEALVEHIEQLDRLDQ